MNDTDTATPHAITAPPPVGLGNRTKAALALSLVAGLAYPFIAPALPPVAAVVAKGSGVALLALAAVLHVTSQRWWLVAIMTAGATGDVLLEIDGLFFAGAGAFAVGHLIAMAFYFQNRQPDRRLPAKLAAIGLIGWGLVMPTLVSPPGAAVGALMLYSVLLCGMAAALLLSRFAILATAGAGLFIVSDTLLIMRLGGSLVADAETHGLLVWMTYYFGQALICIGVMSGLSFRITR